MTAQPPHPTDSTAPEGEEAELEEILTDLSDGAWSLGLQGASVEELRSPRNNRITVDMAKAKILAWHDRTRPTIPAEASTGVAKQSKTRVRAYYDTVEYGKLHTAPAPSSGEGEQFNDAIKQLFLDGIAWGRANPYGATLPLPSQVKGIANAQDLAAQQVEAAVREARVDLISYLSRNAYLNSAGQEKAETLIERFTNERKQ